MAEKKFALVFWSDDQQYSVVAYEDIVGEAKLGEIFPVAWRIRKKKGEVKTCWYEAKILQLSDNEESLQLLCENYAENRAKELNNVAGKKRKRTKTAKAKELDLEEQTPTPSTPTLHDAEMDNDTATSTGKASKVKKKTKQVKEPSLKKTQLESAKLMARKMIEDMQRENPCEKDHQIPVAHNETSSNSASRINTTTPLNSGTSLTVLTPPSDLRPSTEWSSTSNVNPSQRDEVQTRDDDPFSSPANMPPTNFTATNMPIHSTNSHKSSNQTARRELQLLGEETNPDWPDETPVPLSSAISCAIRLSYDCDDEWASKCDEWLNNSIKQKADAIPPECSECAVLRDENARLKGTIARLRKEKQKFAGLLNVPPAAVIYLESLAKYLRDASSDEDCNDEVMEISFPPMAMNKTQKTPPTPAPAKTNVTNTSAVNATTFPPPAVNDTPSSSPSSHFEGGNGTQELCPGSGVFIPTIKLRQCHHKSGSDLKVLFHCLMEHFFSEETLAMSVAFGNRVLPTGKQVLDPNIVSAIKGYLLASAKIFHVAPLESVKLNKMFTNKCTCAQTKLKKKLMAFPTESRIETPTPVCNQR